MPMRRPSSAASRREPPARVRDAGSPELWGGVECTIARHGDRYRDQVVETGHHGRIDDLDRIAELGIRTLRYPVLWETVSPDDPDRCDFTWHDARFARLQQLGITPIAGLIHHGSGPRYTDLLDPAFPRLLARHAARVAERYPWIALYTPVNEPLTTARFSCLYGHWFPHGRDDRQFLTALVAQCRATILSIRAIRRINPDAKLVQTEDLGRVYATPHLAYQADYENERRWLTFDLLFGRVTRHHPWHRRFLAHGIPKADLDLFLDDDVRPDIVGINHYLTSERFLDERIERYPPHLAGGNGREAYADVEAVRMPLPDGELGPKARLTEVWERYRTPLAITEAHHGSTRDEQLRWLDEVWRGAVAARQDGADIRAVTMWSLFGTVDWNSLLNRQDGIYEPGAFDIRGAEPRGTAIARAASQLAATGAMDHPVLDHPGWWRRDDRFYLRTTTRGSPMPGLARGRMIALLGPDGAARDALLRAGASRALRMEVADTTLFDRLRSGRAPDLWGVIELTAGSPAPSTNRGALSALRAWARTQGSYVKLVVDEDWQEAADIVAPAGRFGIRVVTGDLFGPDMSDALVEPFVSALEAGREPTIRADLCQPTYLPDLAHVVLDLLIDGGEGQYRLSSGIVGQRDLARMLAFRLVRSRQDLTDGLSDETPSSGAASASRTEFMPPLSSALSRYLTARMQRSRIGAQAALVAAE